MIERAEERRRATGQPTIFFLDEIHRFNKAQQDALLPAVEEGLRHPDRGDDREPLLRGQLGAALAQPDLRAARRSSAEQVRELLGARSPTPSAGSPTRRRSTTTALELLAERSGGDARTALGGARAGGRDRARVRRARSTSARPRTRCSARRSPSTSEGDHHYDYVSAWIKATRGSDPDASLYYLAVMLEGGEDPRFIARRMVILASEDIGNADPQALARRRPPPPTRSTTSACPSARSTSPRPPPTWRWRRSRTPRTSAISARPTAEVREHGAKPPPDYLRDAHYPGAKAARPRRGLQLPARRAGRRRRPAAVAAGGRRASASTSRPTAGFEAELAERLDAARRRRAPMKVSGRHR